MVEALAETRHLLEGMERVAAVRALAKRRDLLERAAASLELRGASREQVVHLARLILDVRDDAVALRRAHDLVAGALAEAMD